MYKVARIAALLLVTLATATPVFAAASRATLVRGTLRVYGNGDLNGIDVTSNLGVVTVDSLLEGPLGSYPIEDVDRIIIRTRGDADSVFVNVSHFPDVDIVTGTGTDTVEVRGCIEDLRINTGFDDDVVEINRAYVHGRASIETSTGDDIIRLGSLATGTGFFGHLGGGNSAIFDESLVISQGIGDDRLFANRVFFGSQEERQAASNLGVPVDMLTDIDIRISGNVGEDCYEIFNTNVNLLDYMWLYEFDCSMPMP